MRTESNQVTAAAMIWSQHQSPLTQLLEGPSDIVRAQRGTISSDRDDLVITESAHRLDRVFEAPREIGPALPVEVYPVTARSHGSGEGVDIRSDRRFIPEPRKLQERKRRDRQPATRQIEPRIFGKDQEAHGVASA